VRRDLFMHIVHPLPLSYLGGGVFPFVILIKMTVCSRDVLGMVSFCLHGETSGVIVPVHCQVAIGTQSVHGVVTISVLFIVSASLGCLMVVLCDSRSRAACSAKVSSVVAIVGYRASRDYQTEIPKVQT
jgi:hypothetical protein